MFLIHESSVAIRSYHILPQFNNRMALVDTDEGYRLMSNVCPHQKSLLTTSSGFGYRKCPYHGWAFDINGKPISSGRTEHYCKNKAKLKSSNVYSWNRLLFDSPVKIETPIKFNEMRLKEQRIDYVKADYRNVMDLFLDVDHIQEVHDGVYDKLGITDTTVTWDYFDGGSVQTVKQGAYWIAIYPHTMIEWQKGALFITVAIPADNKNHSNVHVFKYTDALTWNEELWNLNESVWETAWLQDKNQAEMLTEFVSGNIEDQKRHYRAYLKKHGIN